MGLRTFKNGVHPFEGKELSKEKPVQELLPKGELVFPVSQHIGAPAKPVVKVGDTVLRGQVIAEAGGFVSAPIHSSVSGTVKKIEPRRVPVGDMVTSIVIESDGKMEEVEYQQTQDVSSLSKEEIIERVKNAGVVGMGGAGFPTHVKLSPKEPDKIDYIIANCAECEPYLTSDYRRMMENPQQLVDGMKIVLQLFPKAKGIFGIENNKMDCVEKLRGLIQDDPRLEVAELLTKYPQGGERQLIYAVTGRAINSGQCRNARVHLQCRKTRKTGNEPYFYRNRGRGKRPAQLLYLYRYELPGNIRRGRRMQNAAGKNDCGRADDGVCFIRPGYPGDQNQFRAALHDKGRSSGKRADAVHQLRALRRRLSGASDPIQACKIL